MKKKRDTMPFSGHTIKDLMWLLKWFEKTTLPVECLDAFLYEYRKTGNLDKAIFFARCEWDC